MAQQAMGRAMPQKRLPSSQLPARIALDRPTPERLSKEMSAQPAKPGVPLKVGFSREVAQLASSAQTAAQLQWVSLAGGQLAAISIASTDALGVRLGLSVDRMPGNVLLRFYAPGAGRVFEATGQEVVDTIARNLLSGDDSDAARTWWSPLIEGAEIALEVELPDGVSPDAVVFSLPRVAHLFWSPLNTGALQEKTGEASSCEVDVMCYTSTWGNESLATAKMLFASAGGYYICTGTLLSDSDPSTTLPYFLSANHCISTQTEASSLETYWFYRASSCNSGILGSSTQTLSGGATLLYASSTTDTSFMRLNSAPPAGVWFSGWSASLPALYANVSGVHHPKGDLQKISFASISDYVDCTSSSSSYSCSSSSAGLADHLEVIWSQGVTESGSSGSGLWATSGSSHYLVGQLHGGSSSCSTPTGGDEYGRFDKAYEAALYRWLGASASGSVALTVSSTGTGSGVVTSADGSIVCGSACNASYSSGSVVTLTATAGSGSTFAGWGGACSGTGVCQVTMSAAQSVSATFTVQVSNFTLIVAKTGTGAGTVVSGDGSINCGTSCSASLSAGTVVSLTATPLSGSTFSGWSGGCRGTGACQLTIGAARTVTATFTQIASSYTLTVSRSGTGSGSVTSSNGSINCGSTCSASFSSGTVLTLSAVAASGSSFTGWSGACSGTGSCQATMSAARSVTATFTQLVSSYSLTVAKLGSGSGSVKSSNGSIDCGNTCNASFTSGTVVTLAAAPAAGSTFSGWSGACSGTAGSCQATMSAARSVSATFVGLVVEYFHAGLGHYFITSNADEIGGLDSNPAWGWVRTGNSFKAGGSTPVCRFYGSVSPGPNSHFYTVNMAECDYLKALQAITPDTERRWNFEGLDFYSTPRVNGLCPGATTPVYQAYNNGFALGIDSNHRITTSFAALQDLVLRGWVDEGVALCAPP
jgi:hypothetical protein